MPVLTSLLFRGRSIVERRTTEAFVVGYPKTGNTWLRFMLGRYAQRRSGIAELPLFDEVDWWGRHPRLADLPRLTFTHDPLRWTAQQAADLTPGNVRRPYAGRTVVLVVRHPLDVLVSNWLQQRTRATPRYKGGLQAFVEDPVFGIEKLFRFYELWADDSEKRPLLFRYEDARRDAGEPLRRVLRHLGADPSTADVTDAVSFGAFDNMRQIERSGNAPRYRSSGNTVFATGDPSDPEAQHVRRGEVGGYGSYLDDETVARLERRVATCMPAWYGYGPEGSS